MFAVVLSAAAYASAQSLQEREFVAVAGRGWWSWIFVLVATVVGLIIYFHIRRNWDTEPMDKNNSQPIIHYGGSGQDSVATDNDLAWLRMAGKPRTILKGQYRRTASDDPLYSNSTLDSFQNFDELSPDVNAYQDRMRKLQYSQLQINSFSELATAKLYEPLPLSDDPAVLTAIEQAGEEFEDDESIRELAVRILTAFRTRNSIEALSQIALYDLSSNLRSKAVSILTDFDHPSVFEAILLACADPTREVRAAAARGLFRLSFDRADAWTRIIETNDEFRMSHAARAAVESGIVAKSFDRLIHEDRKIAYEAFTLVSLMIRAGETETIFSSIKNHRDERIKFALLHVLKTHNDGRTIGELNKLLGIGTLSSELTELIYDTISRLEPVPA